MALQTTTIIGTAYAPDGTLLSNTQVEAQLSHWDDGLVIPQFVYATTGDDGTFSMQLWPNQLGVNGTYYIIRIGPYGSPARVQFNIVVPESSVPVVIDTIINQPPYPPIDEAQQAVAQAQQAATTATEQAGIATQAATTATGAATTAVEQAGIATTQAGIATTQAGIATGAASSASASASAAANSEENAAISANTAAVQAGIATGAASNASASASAAGSSATNAAASATTATEQAGIATTAAEDAEAALAAAKIPAPTQALAMLRVKSDASAYEFRTPAQVTTDLPVTPNSKISGTNVQTGFDTAGLTLNANEQSIERLATGGDVQPFIDIDMLGMQGMVPNITFARNSTATYWDYYGNLATAAVNGLRQEFDPVAHVPLGELLEIASNNIIIQSDNYVIAPWVISLAGDSIVPNAIIGPGILKGSKLVEGTGTGIHSIQQSLIAVSGSSYLYYAIVKAGERTKFRLANSSASPTLTPIFDLVAGTVSGVTAGATAGMRSLGNGLWLCWGTTTVLTTAANIYLELVNAAGAFNYPGDGVSGLYIFHAQGEQSKTSPSSPIITTTSAGTRAADMLSFGSTTGPALFPNGVGTIVVEYDIAPNQVSALSLCTFGALAGTTRRQFICGANQLASADINGANGNVLSSGVAFATGVSRWAISFDGTTRKISVNGSAPVSDTTAGLCDLTGVNNFFIAGHYSGTGLTVDNYNGHFRRIRAYGNAFSDVDLQTASTLPAAGNMPILNANDRYAASTPTQVLGNLQLPTNPVYTFDNIQTLLGLLRYGNDTWPTTDWQALGASVLPSYVTWTRNSTKSYWDANCRLQLNGATINAPAFDHDPNTGAPRGITVERTVSNGLYYSEDFTQWVYTVAVNATVAPYTSARFPRAWQVTVGTTQMTSIPYFIASLNVYPWGTTWDGTKGNVACIWYLPGVRYVCFSYGSGSFVYDTTNKIIISNNIGTTDYTITSMLDGWFKFEFNIANTSPSLSQFHMGFASQYSAGNLYLLPQAGDIGIFAAPQTESYAYRAGLRSTSYIPTYSNAAVIRASDAWTCNVNTPADAGAITFDCEVMPGEVGTTSCSYWGAYNTTLLYVKTVYANNIVIPRSASGMGGSLFGIGTSFAVGRQKHALSFSNGGMLASSLGNAAVSSNQPNYSDVSNVNSIHSVVSGTASYNLWLRNIRWYSVAATAAQIQSRSIP